MREGRNRAALATAKVIPIFLAALVSYASYVVTGPLAINYLINPSYSENDAPRRLAAGLALPIVYLCLVIPTALTWLRLLATVWHSPGHTPRGEAPPPSNNEPAPGLEEFYQRDVFVCDPRGMPVWCHHCQNWKADRAHHNRDVGRCTLKMDHFCPWVGGVVGERSYKFFVQFLLYSLLLSSYTMSIFAYFVAEKARKGSEQNVQWLIVLAIAGFFCLFTLGMVVNSLWMVFHNLTTIENLNAKTAQMMFAVLLPPELQGQELNGPPTAPKPAHLSDTSESDRRPLSSGLNDQSHAEDFHNSRQPPQVRASSLASRMWVGTITYPLHLPVDRPPLPAPELRTFAILETLPGMNPWDLGSPWQNFKTVFGSTLYEWLLPIKHSPCADHSSRISFYSLGPDFEELLMEVGLLARPDSPVSGSSSRDGHGEGSSPRSTGRQRRRKRILDAGWQNGERPDGWISEKEARRLRKEWRRRDRVEGQRHDRESDQ